MGDADPAADGARPRVGRPPRINREMIAEAAQAVGLERLTLKAVADELDVSVAALYHHVSGKDDLVRLAAQRSVAAVPLPVDRGQHWARWLLEWAAYNREVFLAQPGLLDRYLDGMISTEAIAENVNTILGVLVGQGFSILDANAAYELVTSCALGSAVATIRERDAERGGGTLRTAQRELLRRHGDDGLPHVRALLDEIRHVGRRPFEAQITTVLRGIADEQQLEWAPISEQLPGPVGRPRP